MHKRRFHEGYAPLPCLRHPPWLHGSSADLCAGGCTQVRSLMFMEESRFLLIPANDTVDLGDLTSAVEDVKKVRGLFDGLAM